MYRSSKGCPATTHTKVIDGVDTYYKELPNGINHTCNRGPVHLHSETVQKVPEAWHPSLHSSLLTMLRNELENDINKNQFENIIAGSYSYNGMRSTMNRWRTDASYDFTTYPDVKEYVLGVDQGDLGQNNDICISHVSIGHMQNHNSGLYLQTDTQSLVPDMSYPLLCWWILDTCVLSITSQQGTYHL